jgi:hypothetical protein
VVDLLERVAQVVRGSTVMMAWQPMKMQTVR